MTVDVVSPHIEITAGVLGGKPRTTRSQLLVGLLAFCGVRGSRASSSPLATQTHASRVRHRLRLRRAV